MTLILDDATGAAAITATFPGCEAYAYDHPVGECETTPYHSGGNRFDMITCWNDVPVGAPCTGTFAFIGHLHPNHVVPTNPPVHSEVRAKAGYLGHYAGKMIGESIVPGQTKMCWSNVTPGSDEWAFYAPLVAGPYYPQI